MWGDKLLACWEGGLPHALDPATLETLGPTSLGGFCELGPSGRGKPVDLETQHINRVLGMGGTGTIYMKLVPCSFRLKNFHNSANFLLFSPLFVL